MKSCPRLFEVEALRDGRLRGAELARFESHLGMCAVCAAEAEALEALAHRLRTDSNSADVDELRVRRERTRLLAAFDAGLMPASRARDKKPWLVLATAAALLSLLGVLAWSLWPARALPVANTLTQPKEGVSIQADSSTQWSRHFANQVETVVLRSGSLTIRVDRAVTQRRLLVILPDGELEDVGTTFSVSADAGRTVRVVVEDGRVVLRLRGKPPVVLGAGEAWAPPPALDSVGAMQEPPPSLPSARNFRAAPPASVASAGSSERTPMPVTSGVEKGKPAPSSRPSLRDAEAPPSAESVDSSSSADFRVAMTAFNGGDNARADSLFSSFLARHPLDPKAEDAAYLRILARQRLGDVPGTQQAARNYLARYPQGFRRAEVDALLR